MTLSIITLYIHAECIYAMCRYAECRCVITLSVVTQSAVILSVAASVSIHRSISKIKHFCIRKTIQLIMEQSSRYKFRSFGFYFHALAKEN